MSRWYTGIGSRETPPEIMDKMTDFAYRLARLGWLLRSGKAPGADAAFQRGVQNYEYSKGVSHPSLAEIYIPWKGFSGGDNLWDSYDICPDQLDKEFPGYADMRWDWVKEVHPAWDKLKQGARKLHERNVHQLFGKDLGNAFLHQSKFVVYYCGETKGGNPKGGTATAVNLAKKQGIRTINLLHDKNVEIFESFVTKMEASCGINTAR